MVGPVAEHSQYLNKSEFVYIMKNQVVIPVGGEGESVDSVGVVKGVQVLAVIQVPEHGLAVLSTGGAQGTFWGRG